MKKNIKEVVYSSTFYDDLKSVYLYGYKTFGSYMADVFQEKNLHLTYGLSYQYLIYPECRPLETKQQIYRNIISDNHRIIYRIRLKIVGVLRIIHGTKNPATIKSIKKIKIK